MPISTYTIGPGVLTIGSGPLAVSAQIENARVEWSESVTTTEERTVLSGEVLPATSRATHAAVLAGRAIQDLSAGGFCAYTWAEQGEETVFSFTPSNAAGATITGICYPIALTIGGDVTTEGPTSDFTWRCKGNPVPDWA